MSIPNVPRYYSRALKGVEDEIRRCTKPQDVLALRARRASLIAQSSDVATAKKITTELREINRGYEPRLAAWVMYCDGIINYAESYDLRSTFDRIRRAHMFAGAVKDAELAGLCGAWMAFCYFSQGEIEQTAEHLRQAFVWALPKRLSALPRAYLTLADCLSWAGVEEKARRWYHRARTEAAHHGDIFMQDSVIYNSAAFRVSVLNLMQCEGRTSAEAEKLAETELISGTTLNTLIGNTSNRHLTPMVRGELFVALQRWDEARVAFDELFADFGKKKLDQFEPRLLAQYAYCLANSGETAQARQVCDDAVSRADRCKELDDVAILHFRASQVAAKLGEEGRESYHLDASRFALENFRAFQGRFQEVLTPVLELVEGVS